MNNVVLAGRLCGDPELKMTQTGTEFATFTLACDRRFKDASGQKQTDFIYCKAWSKTAVFVSTYFHKGDGLVLNGRIETRRYEDKNGDTRTAVEVVADNVEFAQGKKSDGVAAAQAAPHPAAGQTDFEEIVDDEELPF